MTITFGHCLSPEKVFRKEKKKGEINIIEKTNGSLALRRILKNLQKI